MNALTDLDQSVSRRLLLRQAISSSLIRLAFLFVEWTCHGIPWLIVSVLGTYFSLRTPDTPEEIRWRWFVLLAGIVLDLAAVGLVKIIIRRPRPPYNTDDQVYEAPIADKYSFPSGHTSRAAMLAVLSYALLNPNRRLLRCTITIFPFTLGYTRIAMGRHYASDVIGGLILGVIEGSVVLRIPQTLPADLVAFIVESF